MGCRHENVLLLHRVNPESTCPETGKHAHHLPQRRPQRICTDVHANDTEIKKNAFGLILSAITHSCVLAWYRLLQHISSCTLCSLLLQLEIELLLAFDCSQGQNQKCRYKVVGNRGVIVDAPYGRWAPYLQQIEQNGGRDEDNTVIYQNV